MAGSDYPWRQPPDLVELADIGGIKPRPVVQPLLLCGIAAAVIYVFTDIGAALVYPGFSYTDQAVSELFAIGAPTSHFVVPLFSLSSTMLLAFSVGIALAARGRTAMRWLALMFAASAVDAFVLWNFYPMHMRGAERTFTDLMHLILATNPFVLGTLIVSIFAFRTGFRRFSMVILAAVLLLAFFGFSYATAVDVGEATPGLGLIERLGQYIYQLWQVALALLLLRKA
jgi:hypothetical membrane protein